MLGTNPVAWSVVLAADGRRWRLAPPRERHPMPEIRDVSHRCLRIGLRLCGNLIPRQTQLVPHCVEPI
jgi:hypothetical protein